MKPAKLIRSPLLAAALFVSAQAALAQPAASPSPPAAAPAAPAPPADDTGKSTGDASSAQTIELAARPVAVLSGKGTWDDGFKTITDALKTVNDELAKNNVKAAGRPLAVYLATDDQGFTFQVMVPIDKAPEGKTELSPQVKLGASPAGKAMKFQHRGAYEDIDSTYEAITAYLDEKGLQAQNTFIEEFVTDPKSADDQDLAVDIYVLLK